MKTETLLRGLSNLGERVLKREWKGLGTQRIAGQETGESRDLEPAGEAGKAEPLSWGRWWRECALCRAAWPQLRTQG